MADKANKDFGQEKPGHNLRRASMPDIIKFSFNGLATNIPFVLLSSYLSYFYTDIFGLAPIVVSGILVGTKFIDAFIDPFIGMLNDATRSKMGRFRPWIIFCAPLLAVSMWVVFTVPGWLEGDSKVVYAYVTYILYVILSSLAIVPSNSSAALMTDDPQQRAVVISWKQGMGLIPQFLTAFALPLVKVLGGGAQGWSLYGAILGAAACVAFWISAWGVKPYDTMDRLPQQQRERKREHNALKELALAFKNKPLLILILVFFCSMTVFALSASLNVYYFKYVLGHEDWVTAATSIQVFGGIAGIVATPLLVKIIGKKRLYQVTSGIAIIPNLIMLLTPSPELAFITALFTAFQCASSITGTLGWAMLPDCIDYTEYRHHRRTDGLTTSSFQFTNQMGQALGAALPMMFLHMAGYVANQEQTVAVLGTITFLRWGLPALASLISLIAISFYPLTDERAAEISAELERRHASEGEER